MKDSASNLMKKFTYFLFGPLVSAFIGFVTVPITSWLICPEDMGKTAMFSLGLTLSSLIVYLGLDQGFVREYSVEKDKKNLLWNAAIIPFIFSIILAVIILIFKNQVSYFMFDSFEPYIIISLAISIPISIIDRFNLLIVRMNENGKLYSFLNIFNKLISLILMLVILLAFGKNFKGVINASVITSIICVSIGCFINREYWIHKFTLNKILLNRMVRFSLPLVPASIITWILNSMDRVAMRQWSNFDQIGLYSAAIKITAVVAIVQQAFTMFWAPTAYRWFESGEKSEKFSQVSELLSITLTIIFATVVLFKSVIIMMFSKGYSEAIRLVPFVLLMPIMYTISETTTLGISFLRKSKYNIYISFIAATANYIGNVILVPRYGALGASISTGLSYIIFFWTRTLISSKIWCKFPMKVHVINVNYMLLICIINLFNVSWIVNLLLLIFICLLNKKYLKKILSYINTYIKNMKGKVSIRSAR